MRLSWQHSVVSKLPAAEEKVATAKPTSETRLLQKVESVIEAALKEAQPSAPPTQSKAPPKRHSSLGRLVDSAQGRLCESKHLSLSPKIVL